MNEKILCIELFQPYAQYRNPFTFYYAQTYPLPPKSTIIGMLQNATDRYYDRVFWELKVSVHGGFESVFWNYQQLIKGDTFFVKKKDKLSIWNRAKTGGKIIERPLYNEGIRSQPTPVYQQELFNGHLFVFLKGDNSLIDEIETSLKNPNKILYLGRSEDVIFIENIYNEKDLKYTKKEKEVNKYFRLIYPTYIKRENNNKIFPIKNKKFPVYSIASQVVFENNGIPIENKAQISQKTERKPHFVTVIHTGIDYIILLDKPIGVEYFRLGDRTFKIPEEFGWI